MTLRQPPAPSLCIRSCHTETTVSLLKHYNISVADGQEEAFKVTAALVPQGVLQGHIVLLQVHVFDGLQVILLKKMIQNTSFSSTSMYKLDMKGGLEPLFESIDLIFSKFQVLFLRLVLKFITFFSNFIFVFYRMISPRPVQGLPRPSPIDSWDSPL